MRRKEVVKFCPVNVLENIAFRSEILCVVSNELPTILNSNLFAGAEFDCGIVNINNVCLYRLNNLSNLDVVSCLVEVTEDEVFISKFSAFNYCFVGVDNIFFIYAVFFKCVIVISVNDCERVRHVVDVIIETVTVYIVYGCFIQTAGVNLRKCIYKSYRVCFKVLINCISDNLIFIIQYRKKCIEGFIVVKGISILCIINVTEKSHRDELEVLCVSVVVLISIACTGCVGRCSV